MPSPTITLLAERLGLIQLATRSDSALLTVVFNTAEQELTPLLGHPYTLHDVINGINNLEYGRSSSEDADLSTAGANTTRDALTLSAIVITIPIVCLALVSVPLALAQSLSLQFNGQLAARACCIVLLLDLTFCAMVLYYLLHGLHPRDAARRALRLFMKVQVAVLMVVVSGVCMVMLARRGVRAGVAF